MQNARLFRGVFVARLDGVKDRFDFDKTVTNAVSLSHGRHPQQCHSVEQHVQEALNEHIAAAIEHRGVELGFRSEQIAPVLFSGNSDHLSILLSQPRQDFRIALFRAGPASVSLKQGAQFVELLCFVRGNRADNGAAIGNSRNETFRLQLSQRLADRGSTDTGQLAQLTLDQALTRLQNPGSNRLPQPVFNQYPKARGSSRHMKIGFGMLHKYTTADRQTICQAA